MENKHFVFVLILTIFRFQENDAALCSDSYFGEWDPNSKRNEIESNTDYGYMMGDSSYIINCCGVVDRWEAYFDNVVGSRTIYFQIWRPTSGNTFELVGENPFTVTSDGEQDISISQADRITIKSGDRWGWWSSGTDIITYKKGGGEEDDNFIRSLTDKAVGDTFDWGTTTQKDRSYAVRLDRLPNNAPSFSNLPDTNSILNTVASGTSLFTVTVDDVDTDDVSSLAVSMTANTKFSFDTSTLEISTSTSLLGQATQTVTLSLTVTDQCSNTDTSTYTVTITNSPPVINNLPDSTSISEDITVETLLHTISITDVGDTVTCSIASTTPSSAPFTVKLISTDYGIYVDSNPGFAYNTLNSYSMTIDCTDGGNTVSGTYSVSLIQNTPPVIDSLPASTSISEDVTTETLLHTILVTDTDAVTCSLASTVPAGAPFTVKLVTTDYGIYVDSNPGFDEGVQNSYLLNIDCADNRNTVSSTYTVTLIPNTPPVIDSLPDFTAISEDITAETLLHTIMFNDTDSVTCSLASTVPASAPFSVKFVSTDYGIYVDSNPGFDEGVQNSYLLNIDCADVRNTVSSTYTVSIIANTPPVFTNIQNSTSISTTDSIGTNVFTVLTTDAENDDLTYNMTCTPSSCPFDIFASGAIQLNADLTGTSVVGYDLYITVADSRNTVGPSILTVTIADINDPVLLSNIPLSSALSVFENTALATTVFTVSYSDIDTSQSHTFSMTSSPASGLNYFSIDSSTGELTTVNTILNYENLAATPFTFSVTVTDPVTSDTQSLVIDISDVNETPSFSQSSYSLSATEGVTGEVLGTPSFGISDPDSGDSYTLAMDCSTYTGYFLMGSPSGEVSYQSNYDLDTGLLPSTVTCTVTLTDTGGLTDTATLTITIDDENDNTPTFSPTTYIMYISYYADVGTTVGTVTATDADTGGFGVMTFTLDQASLGAQYFSISNVGNIHVNISPKSSALNYSSSVTITASATDTGGLTDIATVLVVISGTTTVVTTTTTDRYRTFFEDTKNIAWIVACVVILVVILGLSIYIIYTCNGKNGCQQCSKQLCKKQKTKYRRRRRPSTSFSNVSEYHSPQNYRRSDFRQPGNSHSHLQLPSTSGNSVHSVRPPPPPKSIQSWRNEASSFA